jgi:hypothetical protein
LGIPFSLPAFIYQLANEQKKNEYNRIENKLFKGINIGGINRADVADFLIKQVENQTELKKYVGISEK